MLAAELATQDHLSNGRLNVGVGSGWMPEEFAAASVAHLFPRRHGHVRETIEIMQGIWDGRTTCSSTTASSPTSSCCGFGHKPLQQPGPPIYFSGLKDAKRSAKRIAKYGLQGWIGIQDSPEDIKRWKGEMERELNELGQRLPRRLRHVQHDLVRHHRRADGPDRRPARAPTCSPAPPSRSRTSSSATRKPA